MGHCNCKCGIYPPGLYYPVNCPVAQLLEERTKQLAEVGKELADLRRHFGSLRDLVQMVLDDGGSNG